MKKYAIILLFLSVVLTGCNTNNTQTISFEQTATIFSDNIKSIQKITDILGFTGNKAINLSLETHGESQDFKLNSDLTLSGIINHQENAVKGTLDFDLFFLDKSEQKENKILGDTSTILKDSTRYFSLNNSVLNIGTGNYQGDLLNLVFKNLENKRVSISQSQNSDFQSTSTYIKFLLDILSDSTAFTLVEEITYDGNLAYKIAISVEDLNINSFDSMFIVHSLSDIELKIEKADIYLGDQKYFIRGSISSKAGNLSFQSPDLLERTIQISWENTKKSTSLVVSSLLNLQEIVKLELKLSPKLTPSKTIIQINGLLSISPLIIYGSDLEKNIQIDINGQYVFKDIEQALIEVPASYVLGEQILGDQFSLETIMVETK